MGKIYLKKAKGLACHMCYFYYDSEEECEKYRHICTNGKNEYYLRKATREEIEVYENKKALL